MAFSNILTGLNATRVANIHRLLDELETECRFSIKLTPEQRSAAPAIGKRRSSFVITALRWARQFPRLLPGFRNINDYERTAGDYDWLLPVLDRVKTLQEKLDDTVLQIGSNYFEYSRSFYTNAKEAADGNEPGTETVVRELSEYFVKKNGTEVIVEEDPKPADDNGQTGTPNPIDGQGNNPA